MERFLTFFPARNLDAQSLTKYILDTLAQYHLDPKMIVSQGYDGASVMSGRCTGVQQRIREVAPNACYIHCHAHVLNLVLVDCVKNNSHASEFFSLVQPLYVIISTSKGQTLFIEAQKRLHPDKQIKQLQSLSDTRWACRSLALNTIASTYSSIIETLECLGDDADKAKAIEAIGLFHQVSSFKFLSSLIIFQRIFSITKSLSDQLQCKTLDFVSASSIVMSTKQTLKDLRSIESWQHTYTYIKSVADMHDIDEIFENSRRKRPPRRIQDSVLIEPIGHRESLSCSDSIRINVYFPVLDHILSEFERRFSNSNLDLMKSIDACNPLSPHFLDSSLLSSLASLYNICNEQLSNECLLAKPILKDKAETLFEAYTHLCQCKLLFLQYQSSLLLH